MRSRSIVTQAIKPSDVDRFDQNPQIVRSGQEQTRSGFALLQGGGCEIVPGQIHPEGARMYSRGQLVSDQAFTRDLVRCGNQLLEQLSARGLKDITLFLRRKENVIEHYVVDHLTESVTWVTKQRPEALSGLPDHHEHNMLKEEYWTHMENFPGPRYVEPRDIQRLKDILSSLAIDHGTSEGSTAPFSAEQMRTFLELLSMFGKCPNEFQTYAVARLWNMIWHARTVNNYGGPSACLDRFTVLSDGDPSFTISNHLMEKLMLGAAGSHSSRCARAWTGRVAYVTEWRSFKSKNEREWKQISELASVLVIASLMIHSRGNLKLLGVLSTLLASTSAAFGYRLILESQNLGDNASDAAVYFQQWELPEINVQRLAIRNAMPLALLIWALMAFVLLILSSYVL